VKNNEYAVLEQSNLSLKKHGIEKEFTMDNIRMLYGKAWADYFRWLLPNEKDETIKSLVAYAESLDDQITPKHIKPMDYAVDVLKEIKSRGDKILVISASNAEALDKFLKWASIDYLVDDRIGISREEEQRGMLNVAEVKCRKLKEYIKNKNFCKIIVVGDTEDDIKAGMMIGAITFYFNQNGKKSGLANYSISDLRKILEV
jgi:phosphoserine phosphatase